MITRDDNIEMITWDDNMRWYHKMIILHYHMIAILSSRVISCYHPYVIISIYPPILSSHVITPYYQLMISSHVLVLSSHVIIPCYHLVLSSRVIILLSFLNYFNDNLLFLKTSVTWFHESTSPLFFNCNLTPFLFLFWKCKIHNLKLDYIKMLNQGT
jgi:hypothetical protein